MEIESFQDPDFNAINWINASFKNIEPEQNKETLVLNLVSKLQLYVQQVNSALEGTSQQVLVALPKIMKDAQNLQHDATLMRAKMSEIQNNIAEVQKKTGACMGKIEHLDALKTKLQTSKQGLQESDGWGHLTTELEDLLEHKDIEKACDKLQSLQKSLTAQVGLPGQIERESQVEGFKNRIEALISPDVIESFTLGNIEQSQKHVQIYRIMERFAHLTYYYRTVSKDTLQKQWLETVELAKHSASYGFLREFYDFLLEYWRKQYKWCSNVFENSGTNEPTLVLIEMLNQMEPSRGTAITNCLKSNDDKMKILQEISSATIYFGSVMQKQIDGVSIKPKNDEINSLISAIYDFFMAFIPAYASTEQSELSGKIDELHLIQISATESVRNFGNANSKLFKWSEEALRRCNLITQNIGLPALIAVFNQTFKTYLENYKKAQRQLHSTRGNAQNWSLVQCCVTLLQHIGNFVMQLEEFENFISDKILAKETELSGSDSAATVFGYKFVDKTERNKFWKLVEQIKDRKQLDYTAIECAHGGDKSIFEIVFKDVKPLCEYIHDTMTSAVFQPIQHHMSVQPISSSTSASGSNLPDYSFAPQELITQIGQYLLTLPQHLEPLLLAPSQQLKTALKECDENYAKNVPSIDILLSLIVDESCALYEEKIMQLSELNDAQAKQLATDIKYLGSVLEDLGLNLGTRLHQISVLLRATPDTYLNESAGYDPKLVTSIRQIRHIVSVE